MPILFFKRIPFIGADDSDEGNITFALLHGEGVFGDSFRSTATKHFKVRTIQKFIQHLKSIQNRLYNKKY